MVDNKLDIGAKSTYIRITNITQILIAILVFFGIGIFIKILIVSRK